jgi:hypothetical protein
MRIRTHILALHVAQPSDRFPPLAVDSSRRPNACFGIAATIDRTDMFGARRSCHQSRFAVCLLLPLDEAACLGITGNQAEQFFAQLGRDHQLLRVRI